MRAPPPGSPRGSSTRSCRSPTTWARPPSRSSTLRRKVEADPADATIPAEFRRWTYAAGAYSDGLANRREEEIKM